MMKVLSVASEIAPLVKTGGLADVTGALPGALARQDCEVRTLVPGYPQVEAKMRSAHERLDIHGLMGGAARLLEATVARLGLFILDAPHLYNRAGQPYTDTNGIDFADNPERFAALCQIAARIARDGVDGWKPDIVHCHDWQAALTPIYTRTESLDVPTVLTIHNVAFHGRAPAEKLRVLGLPEAGFVPDGFEFWGSINALKGGINYADAITTVSPTYAEELLTPEFGMGLDGVLRQRRTDLVGILNGIDEEMWDPAADEHIAATYTTPRGKAKNRTAIMREMDVPAGEGPLCAVVSRLTGQKGLDLLLETVTTLLDRGGRLILLGSGDATLERSWLNLAEREPRVVVRIGYDEALSHRIIAGADAILVPSRFEPCGLTQLYGLRYGTIPLVALTGGLADTVINASDAGLKAKAATGLQVHPVTAEALRAKFSRLCDLYAQPKIWSQLQRNAMKHPVGWDVSAAEYAELYRSLGPRQ